MERYIIKTMAAYLKRKNRFVGVENVVRDMNICVKLLDIATESDKDYKAWLHASYGGEKAKEKQFHKYINVKNRKRFLTVDFLNNSDSPVYNALLVEYRKQKAWHLYNKIRTYKIWSWWD
jgi:hypothetical protein